jgi:hypothetical protein
MNFGFSVAIVKDQNRDGYAELAVGAPLYSNGQASEGAVWVWRGGYYGLEGSAYRVLEKNQVNAKFGWSVSNAIDVNDDDYGDLIAGAPFYDNGESDEGAAFVYHGSSSGIGTSSNWSAESNQANAQFGYSVCGVQDLYPWDGSEVIVGAPYYDYGAIVDGGGVFVWYGTSGGLGSSGNPTNVDWAQYNQTSDTSHCGWSVSSHKYGRYASSHPAVLWGSPGVDHGGLTDRGDAMVYTDAN